MIKLKTIKHISASIIIYTTGASLVVYKYLNAEYSLSVIGGGAFMLFNFFGLAFFWWLIFSKKSVAWPVFGMIIKYLFLVALLWSLSQALWLKPLGFILGMFSLLFAIVSERVWGALKNRAGPGFSLKNLLR